MISRYLVNMMARIFVSSTIKDLEEHRKKVSLALKQIGHEDVAMKYFVAEVKRPLNKCQEAVASSDLYIGIFALRYGYKPPRYKKSITELEYRKAIECGIDCLIFMLHDDALWPVKFVDKGEDSVKLESLRKELSKKHIVKFFKSSDELAKEVNSAVYNWEKRTGKSILGDGKITGVDIMQYTEAIIKKYCNLDFGCLTPHDEEIYLEDPTCQCICRTKCKGKSPSS